MFGLQVRKSKKLFCQEFSKITQSGHTDLSLPLTLLPISGKFDLKSDIRFGAKSHDRCCDKKEFHSFVYLIGS